MTKYSPLPTIAEYAEEQGITKKAVYFREIAGKLEISKALKLVPRMTNVVKVKK